MSEFKFGALSQSPDSEGEAEEERRMFVVDTAAENMETGVKPEIAEPETTAAVQATAADDGAQGGESASTPTAPEPEPEPDDEEEDEAKKTAAALDSLMRLAAGQATVDEVKIVAPTTKQVSASAFQALGARQALDPETEAELDDLARALADAPGSMAPAEEAPRGAARGAAAPAQGQAGSSVPMVGGAAAQFGEIAGQALATVIATPFVALTSAARHLKTLVKAGTAAPATPANAAGSLQASKGLPFPMMSTLETITDWKCERIEKAAEAVEKAASALMGTEEFVTWEDNVRGVAAERGESAADVVRNMHHDPALAPVKDKMDRLWQTHGDKVAAYRNACDDFERNIRNVVKEYPNSDDGVKRRVADAMGRVETKTEGLPGYGDKFGEYTKALADRVRELAQMIADFVSSLMRRMGGRTRDSDLTM